MDTSALVYIGLTIAVVALALFIDNKERILEVKAAENSWSKSNFQVRNRILEIAIYILLTAVSALRIAVGNDYWEYRFNFTMIADNRHVASEATYNAIIRFLVNQFGYDNYLPIFAIFSIVTVLFFVLALHSQGQYYWFSLFLLMTGGYYFNSLNTVRYYLALAIALYSMKHVLQRNFLKFLFWILVGALFHMTILIVIPAYLLAYFLASHRINKWLCIPAGLFLLSLIFGQNLYRKLIFLIYPFYENSAFDNGELSYINLAKCVAVFLLCAICYRQCIKKDVINRFYSILNLFGLIAFCCGGFIPEVTRIGFYMIASQIFLIPRLVMSIKRKWLHRLVLTAVLVAFTLYFALLLHQMYQTNIRLLPYYSWLFL